MLRKNPIVVKGIDGKETKIEYINIATWMSNNKPIILKIFCFSNMLCDSLLKNKFLHD